MSDTQTLDEVQFAEEIANGIDWLHKMDEQGGYEGEESWFWVLNVDKLDLISECNCVLGQLEYHIMGDADPWVTQAYSHLVGVGKLLSELEALSYGFTLDWGQWEDSRDRDRVWKALTRQWRAAILDLRERYPK